MARLDGCRPAARLELGRLSNGDLAKETADRRVRAVCGAAGGVLAVCGRAAVRQPDAKAIAHTTVGFAWWAWAGRVTVGSWAVGISGTGCSGTGWRYPNYPELFRVSQVSTRNYQINFGYSVLRVRVRVTGNGFFCPVLVRCATGQCPVHQDRTESNEPLSGFFGRSPL
jgi:hypothetical protein